MRIKSWEISFIVFVPNFLVYMGGAGIATPQSADGGLRFSFFHPWWMVTMIAVALCVRLIASVCLRPEDVKHEAFLTSEEIEVVQAMRSDRKGS